VKGKTDITFIEHLHAKTSREIATKRRFKSLIFCLKKGYTTQRTAKYMKMSGFTVGKLRVELKAAFKKGFKDLESYLAAGRPCKYENKVLA
jgi:hypothetical protein